GCMEGVGVQWRAEGGCGGDECGLLQGASGGDARAAKAFLGGTLQGARCSAVVAERGQSRAGEAEDGEQQREERPSHQSTAPVQVRLPMKIHSVALMSGMFEA